MKIRRYVIGIAVGLVVSLVPAWHVLAETDGGFSDVTSDHPYALAINELAGRGVVSGFGDGTFRPGDSVSRMHIAKMIVKTMGYPVSQDDICPFGDVPKNLAPQDPLYPDKYVAVCAAKGITKGKSQGRFDPYGKVTRAQLVTMAARAADLGPAPSDWSPPFGVFSVEHYPWARAAAYNGLFQGLQGMGSDNDFLAAASRGEAAQILHNLLSLLNQREEPAAQGVATVWIGETRLDFTRLVDCRIDPDLFMVEGASADGSLWIRIRHASPPTRQPAEPSFSSLDIGRSPGEQPASVFAGSPAGVSFSAYDPAQGTAAGEAWGMMNGEEIRARFRVECAQDQPSLQ